MKRNDRTFSSQKTLRPTTGKVREALFNILRDRIRDARFLDLYAGTGVIGIEALKQGASEVVLVETSKSSVKSIHEVIRKNRFSDRARVIGQKAVSYIEWAGANQLMFDIIFLDPPYHSDEIIFVLSAIDNTPVLKEGGIVVAEHFTKKVLPEEFDNLHKTKDYNYGDSVLSIYEQG
jgi:16S rRNA (guanine(966)-N(2))-methyltransferase RsmD